MVILVDDLRPYEAEYLLMRDRLARQAARILSQDLQLKGISPSCIAIRNGDLYRGDSGKWLAVPLHEVEALALQPPHSP